MSDPSGGPSQIKGYHAHVYYSPQTRAIAARLRAGIGERFDAKLGSWHDEPVGPHPTSMYQVAFEAEEFPTLVPWLMLNRGGLDVLVHPLTGDSVADHTRCAAWLGTPLPLRIDVLRRGPRPQ
jgi:aromatic ring-cleaving dioxygenase